MIGERMVDKVRVILADDRAAVRSSLRLLLGEEPAFEVVAEAADALGLLRVQVQERVELILIDWELPGLPLPQLLHLLRYQGQQPLIVAMSSNPASRQEALDAGVDAFVDKSQSPDQVLGTLRALPVKRTRDADLLTSRPNVGSLD
jgi:DNA-binding NarL/FixJ family response regulator